MSNEAVTCFQSLLKDVPVWIADLENILKEANRRQAEYLSSEQPASASVTSSRRSSLASLHSDRGDNEVPLVQATPSATTLLEQQMPHLTQEDQLRLAQRKRKTASVCSRAESHPAKYRSRSMVVVYYDGDTQKALENVVRAVGSSRNSIRKGKLSAKLDSLTRSDSTSSCNSSAGEETIKGLGTFTYRTTTTMHRSSQNNVKSFDKVDAALEQAQTFCERAAHQILRDGDCDIEISKAKQQLDSTIEVIEAELPDMLKKADKYAKRWQETEDAKPVAATSDMTADILSIPSDGVLEVDSDEGSGDSEDDGDFQVSMIRLPPRLSKFQVNRCAAQTAPAISC